MVIACDSESTPVEVLHYLLAVAFIAAVTKYFEITYYEVLYVTLDIKVTWYGTRDWQWMYMSLSYLPRIICVLLFVLLITIADFSAVKSDLDTRQGVSGV